MPHDRIIDRFSGLTVPNDGSLSLIGDTNSLDVAGFELRFFESTLRDLQLAAPDLRGIVLDPTWLGINLLKFFLSNRNYASFVIEYDGARTGCSLIKS